MGAVELTLVLVSATLHAGWNFVNKSSRDPLAFSLAMGATEFLPIVALLPFFDPTEVPTPVWWLGVASGVSHAVYFYGLAKAYEHGDLSLAYPISRSGPAFVPLAAIVLFGERLSVGGGIGVLVVLAGAWLVQTNGAVRLEAFRERSAGWAYLALAASVVFSLVDKEAMTRLSAAPWTGAAPRSVVFYFLFCAIYGTVFVPLVAREVGRARLRVVVREEFGRIAGASVAGFASYGLILEALRTALVSYVVAVRQVSVLLAVAFAIAWLGERPGRARIIGATATVAGIALIALAP